MIGIITFHGSHNHGSMLQAYATQQAIKKLGYESEIINFRMKSQKDYYALYQTKYGAMRFFRGLFLLPIHKARADRFLKFESFLNKRYILSGKELSTYDDLESVSNKYDCYLSGSDQIWSSLIPELVGSSIDYSGVYFLNFVNKGKHKISYASSIGESKLEDLQNKKEYLKDYDSLSTREEKGSLIIENLVHKKVETVIDPTLLLTKDDWRKISGERIVNERYILLYTLQGIRTGIKWAKQLKKISEMLNTKVVAVSPFFPIVYPGIKTLVNVGPEDFINLIDNADLVFTDSFHGTAFSINLGKQFFSLTKKGSADNRKKNLLKIVGLEDRCIDDIESLHTLRDYSIDYTNPNKQLELCRKKSFNYLVKALGGKRYYGNL